MALALADAYEAGILHRDFSPGNVIITDDGTGRLIDWDLSKPKNTKQATPRRATRTVCPKVTPCSD
jgi:RIO-like serine/threonine protein kinase